MQRSVFFISDSTGITAETLGRSLLTQFQEIEFDQQTIAYVNSPEKAREALTKINQAGKETRAKPLVFSTLADPKIREIFNDCCCFFVDFFEVLLY